MSAETVVVVAGAHGVTGRAAAEHWSSTPDTKVYGLERRNALYWRAWSGHRKIVVVENRRMWNSYHQSHVRNGDDCPARRVLLGVLVLFAAIIGAVLSFVYFQVSFESNVQKDILG